ncbi:MAG: choice-of-anchor K domain-containing protein [Cyanobacteria bacterium SID2]|nr:choice-of-anchor K domain-containing protein [Cyanobacteria bacterium SID2]MBP0004209.1 choice-of-anchor K domain-containing protein [Cyanobacteria bacterium SBC]
MQHPTRILSVAGLTALFWASSHASYAITLNSAYGFWNGSAGGTNVRTYNQSGSFLTPGQSSFGENQIRWGFPFGNPSSPTFQSGLGFSGVGTTRLNAGQVFQLGTLRHFNNPVNSGTAASSAFLSIVLNFVEFGVQQFDFTLDIDETLNRSGTCPYFSVTPCSDRISWANTIPSQTFVSQGVEYTLELLGFSDTPASQPRSEFISQEGGTSQTFLFAQLSALTPTPTPTPAPTLTPRPTPAPSSSVPEPNTIVGLLGIGLSIVRWQRRENSVN